MGFAFEKAVLKFLLKASPFILIPLAIAYISFEIYYFNVESDEVPRLPDIIIQLENGNPEAMEKLDPVHKVFMRCDDKQEMNKHATFDNPNPPIEGTGVTLAHLAAYFCTYPEGIHAFRALGMVGAGFERGLGPLTPMHLLVAPHTYTVTHKRKQLWDDYAKKVGADLSIRDSNGDSVLHYAVVYRHIYFVFEMISDSVPINPVNDDGHTPLDYAYAEMRWSIAELLRLNGAKTGEELAEAGKI